MAGNISICGVDYEDIVEALPGIVITDCHSSGTEATCITEVEMYLKRAWSSLRGELPYRYREMIGSADVSGHVPGELFRPTTSGQTTFTLGLAAASSTGLLVFVDYSKAWENRHMDDALESSEWSLSGQTLTVTDGVWEDSWVIVEYDHDGTCLTPSDATDDYTLVDHLIPMAAGMLGRKIMQRTGDGELLGFVRDYMDEVNGWLGRVKDGDAGIPFLDEIELYQDWDVPSRGARSVRALRG